MMWYDWDDIEGCDAYLKQQPTEELIRIAEGIYGPAAAESALYVLNRREPQMALEIGLDILANAREDKYLQDGVWSEFFYENKELLIQTVNERSAPIEDSLLNEIVEDLLIWYPELDVPKDFLEKLADTYEGYSQAEKDAVHCDFEKFLELYLPERR